jgi:DNA polymerase III subunit delta'
MPRADDAVVVAPAAEPQVLPWHDAQWSTLTRDLARLPHALLLHGQAGIGKDAFASRLVQFLLCLNRHADEQACGRCHSCTLFRAGNHPDFVRIAPLEDSSTIVVDQIRGVIEFLSLKAHTASHKIVVVSPAQAMNVNAANSLLKVLEEPPPESLLILVASHLSRVPMTIRSRCVRMLFQAPPLPQATAWLGSQAVKTPALETWLSHAGGAPLAALALAREQGEDQRPQLQADLAALATGKADPVRCAERWKSIGTEQCLEWLYRFVVDAVRLQHPSAAGGTVTTIPNLPQTLSISFIDLFLFLDSISTAKKQLGTGLDETLALEDLLIRWCEMTARAV